MKTFWLGANEKKIPKKRDPIQFQKQNTTSESKRISYLEISPLNEFC